MEKLNSQQFNNWYFPSKAGITFNTNPPTPLFDGLITSSYGFSCASISDKNGMLLFYTDGVNVWNKNHQLMPNGIGLFGAGSQINSALILQSKSDENKYFIFTSDGLTGITSGQLGYRYSIIDMNMSAGLGDVIQKNIFLFGSSSEKITAIPHSDGIGTWVIFKDWTDKYYAYLLSCNGLSLIPEISSVGFNLNLNINQMLGDIKSSSNGMLTISVFQGVTSYFEVLKFNSTSGKFIKSYLFTIPNFQPYSAEFSNDCKFAYLSGSDNTTGFFKLYQIKVDNYDSAAIINSAQLISYVPNKLSGALQLAPDNKIYHASFGNVDSLDVINFPNNLGLNCIFQRAYIGLGGRTAAGRFPYSYVNLITNQNVQIPTYTVASDCRTVTLTGKTYIKGNNLTFKWKFGDGDSTIQTVTSGGDTTFTTVTHLFPLGIDTFNVQLFVTSDTVCGLGSAGKKVVLKPPKPTAKFGAAINGNSLQVNFTDSSLLNFNPSLSYQWQFYTKQNLLLGSSSLQNPIYTFPTQDTFKVRLIVRSALVCVQADTLTKTIVLKAKPNANFNYNNNCGSLTVNFNNTSTVVADTLQNYYWNFGDGNSSTIKNPNHNYAAFGNYTVKLVVTSSLGCVSDTFRLPVSIKAKPVANFMYNNNGCAGLAVLLQDSAYVTNSSVANHYWQLPNGNSFNTATINPIFTSGGNYAIRYAVSSAQGCVSDTLIKTIFIESIPLAAIVPVIGGCANESLSFVSSSSIAFGNIKNYKWKFTNTDSINQPNPNINFIFTNAGNYNITHQVISNNGCVSNTATTPISIESKPTADFSNGLICLSKQVNFINESTNAVGAVVNNQWFINNTLISNNSNVFNYTFNQPGNYQVALKVATANGCSDTITKNIVVAPAIANAGNDTIVREGEPFVLNGSGGVSYVWQPPTGLDDITKSNPVGILNNSQRYAVKITTAQGCVGFDTVLITVLRNLKIPNAFSPNGDGIHETWEIEQLKDYPNASVQLFNKNGQLVYSAKGNSIAPWNGMMNNKPVPVGVYYYVIALNSQLYSKPYSGWVMVVK
jgi:gliding motility-associated-like protein